MRSEYTVKNFSVKEKNCEICLLVYDLFEFKSRVWQHTAHRPNTAHHFYLFLRSHKLGYFTIVGD